MNPVDRVCAELLERQGKRTILHLNFGSAVRANADAPRFRASHGASDESPPFGLQPLSQERRSTEPKDSAPVTPAGRPGARTSATSLGENQ
jgi:hypothetical protein